MITKFVIGIAGFGSLLANIIMMVQGGSAGTNSQHSDGYKEAPQQYASLFDFSTLADLNDWTEQSDTVRTVGMSKATLVLQQTQVFQRAILFTLLNPQPNGAGFAGIRTHTMFDLSDYDAITLHVRGQGSNKGYKVVLRHKSQDDEPHPTYEQMFEAPMGEFYTVRLPLDKFKPFYRGKIVNDTVPLDRSHITSLGLQVYGGVYLPVKQSGPSSLEIDWIRADF